MKKKVLILCVVLATALTLLLAFGCAGKTTVKKLSRVDNVLSASNGYLVASYNGKSYVTDANGKKLSKSYDNLSFLAADTKAEFKDAAAYFAYQNGDSYGIINQKDKEIKSISAQISEIDNIVIQVGEESIVKAFVVTYENGLSSVFSTDGSDVVQDIKATAIAKEYVLWETGSEDTLNKLYYVLSFAGGTNFIKSSPYQFRFDSQANVWVESLGNGVQNLYTSDLEVVEKEVVLQTSATVEGVAVYSRNGVYYAYDTLKGSGASSIVLGDSYTNAATGVLHATNNGTHAYYARLTDGTFGTLIANLQEAYWQRDYIGATADGVTSLYLIERGEKGVSLSLQVTLNENASYDLLHTVKMVREEIVVEGNTQYNFYKNNTLVSSFKPEANTGDIVCSNAYPFITYTHSSGAKRFFNGYTGFDTSYDASLGSFDFGQAGCLRIREGSLDGSYFWAPSLAPYIKTADDLTLAFYGVVTSTWSQSSETVKYFDYKTVTLYENDIVFGYINAELDGSEKALNYFIANGKLYKFVKDTRSESYYTFENNAVFRGDTVYVFEKASDNSIGDIKMIENKQYAITEAFLNGTLLGELNSGNMGVWDKDGNIIVVPKYDEIQHVNGDIYIVRIGIKKALLDSNGTKKDKLLTEFIYMDIECGVGVVLATKENEMVDIFDNSGKLIFADLIDGDVPMINPFASKDMATAFKQGKVTMNYYFTNKKGNIYSVKVSLNNTDNYEMVFDTIEYYYGLSYKVVKL